MDPERPDKPDDATLGALIREVADDWRMPPQRLDDVTWRERVEASGPSRRGAGGRGGGLRWTGRLLGATALALVATVIVSFAAVRLTAPPIDVGLASPSPSATPEGSPSAEPSQLPKVAVFGDLPSVTSILVRDGGRASVVDLTIGDITTGPFGTADGPSAVVADEGGGWICVCVRYVLAASDPPIPGGQVVTLDVADAKGQVVSSWIPVRDLRGSFAPDASSSPSATPAVGVPQPDFGLPSATDVRVTLSPDRLLAFLGWSQHDPVTGWETGVDVIDLSTLEVIETLTLPNKMILWDKVQGSPDPVWAQSAPSVAMSPSGDRLLVSGFWYLWSDQENVPTGTDHWTVAWDGTQAGEPVPAGSSEGSECAEQAAGFIDATRFYAVCWLPSGGTAVEQRNLEGTVVARTEAAGAGSIGEDGPLIVGNVLFLWDPISRWLDRIDLLTSDHTRAQAPIPSAAIDDEDVLATIGRRIGEVLAPTTQAKILLQPALVASPDGSRLYALGITLGSGDIGSQGVFVFDARTLDVLDHWPPTGDFASIAISADGAFVYAAGKPIYDPNGSGTILQRPSITVFDTVDGNVRLIAGQLDSTGILFPDRVLR